MGDKEPLDLSTLLSDALSLQLEEVGPMRRTFTKSSRDHFQTFVQMDPMDILGETRFGKPRQMSEDAIGTPVQEFYRGANILITGGTGFVGKLLIERLIRSVPHLGHIYLFVRSKRGTSSQERFLKLFEDKVFLRMKTEVPDFLEKMSCVPGDLSKPGLGLSEQERNLMKRDRIHIVVHCAADVRFIEPLRTTLDSNVIGTKRMLELARQFTDLKSFVYVSTAYSQCVRRVIDETIPTMSIGWKEILRLVDSKTDDELEKDPSILQNWPNTYTFSKAVCEDMIREEANDLPIAIVRPSVVLPSYREPVRGYIDNQYGPIASVLGLGTGVLHCRRVDDEISLDSVPVDCVAACIVAAAWQVGTDGNTGTLPVYNLCMTAVNFRPWKLIFQMGSRFQDVWPYMMAIWYRGFFITQSYWVDYFANIFLHIIPGMLFDRMAVWSGRKLRLSRIYKQLDSLKENYVYFSFRVWEFKNDNVMRLWRSLGEEDRRLFHFDLRDVDMAELFLVGKLGLRYYLLKEGMDTIPAATRKWKILKAAHYTLMATLTFFGLNLLALAARHVPL